MQSSRESGPFEAWHALGVEDAVNRLKSDRHQGLSEAEATARLSQYGYNELKVEKRPSPLRIFLNQFKNVLIIILLAATVISVLLRETLDATVIFAIVIAVSLLGFTQEYRAERALEALKKMAAPTATVLREGEEQRIPARHLVPGDLVLLATGDRVPADGRLVEAVNLEVDEASLTGESIPVDKVVEPLPPPTALADRKNILYAGTTVTYGRGRAMVFATGGATEFGRIASMIQAAEKPKTPLETRMERIGRLLGGVMVVVAAAVIALGLLRGESLPVLFLWAVSLAVAAVPEALPAVVTGGLAIGVRRMAKRNAIVRRLPAVETLGSTTVICSDKTGTMTKGEMTVRQLVVAGTTCQVSGSGYDPSGEIVGEGVKTGRREGIEFLTRLALLCNDARLTRLNAGPWKMTGDPTEAALVAVAIKAGHSQEDVRARYPRVGEVPFSSERKRMTTIHRTPSDQILCAMKGAPEVVVRQCTRVYDEDGAALPMSPEAARKVLATAERMAGDALRVLGFAYKLLPRDIPALDEDTWERDMTFVGLAGIIDPPREEVKDAIRKCEEAGLQVVMITGDHKLTAQAIAGELGLLKNQRKVLTGVELDALPKKEFAQMVEDVAVYARVSPEHKMKIVDAWKERGHIVAMTGDGVNDAPALKRADIGVAMGITGTDVTKEAGDMVLADDNFASIVAAVEEGRGIFDNIRKYLLYLVSANIAEILLMFTSSIVGLPLPLLPVQILYVNLATDGLPALALGLDPPGRDIMRRPPRDPRAGVFSGIKGWIVAASVVLAVAGMLVYVFTLATGSLERARTLVFASVIVFELLFAFSCRSQNRSIFEIGFTSNHFLALAVVWEMILLTIILYSPLLGPLFHVEPIALRDLSLVGAAGVSGFIGAEIWKSIMQVSRRQRQSVS